MKVIICGAAPNPPGYGFPKNHKPRTLCHFKGEVLLERTVNMLHSFGLHDIRFVTGYRHELIYQFVKERNVDIELVYSPSSADAEWISGGWTKGFDTLRAGLKDVDDDVIIMFGDTLLCSYGIPKLLESKYRFAVTRNGHGCQIMRFPRDYLPELRGLDGVGFGSKILRHVGITHFTPESELAAKEKGIDIIWTADGDIDVYRATDEGQAWHLSLAGIDRKHWAALSHLEKRSLLESKGIKYGEWNGKIIFFIEGHYGTSKNYDFYGVDLDE